MVDLKHPAAEAVDRIESEDEDADVQEIISNLSRAELKYVIAEVGGAALGWDAEAAKEAVYADESSTVTKQELRALAAYFGGN